MGALASKLQYEFDNAVRQRGREYFSGGAVHIDSFTESSVNARVTGGSIYSVVLKLSFDPPKGSLLATCTCAYYKDIGPCKHVWATILEADVQRKLQPPPNVAVLSLSLDDDRLDAGADVDEDEDDLDVFLDDDEVDDDDESAVRRPGAMTPRRVDRIVSTRQEPAWKQFVNGVNRDLVMQAAGPLGVKTSAAATLAPAPGESVYVVNAPQTFINPEGLVLEVQYRERKQNGQWGLPKSRAIERAMLPTLADPLDRHVCSLMLGGESTRVSYSYYSGREKHSSFALSHALQEAILPPLARAGRLLLLAKEYAPPTPLALDEGPPWVLHLELNPDSQRGGFVLSGSLRRDGERRPLTDPVMLFDGLWVFWPDRLSRLNDSGAFPFITALRKHKEIYVPQEQSAEFVAMLQKLPRLPPLDAPQELRVEEVHVEPMPFLRIKKPLYDPRGNLRGELAFDYNGAVVLARAPERGVYLPSEKRLYVRNEASEHAAARKLLELGFRFTRNSLAGEPELPPRNLPRVVATLIADKWRVEADGKLYRTPGEMKMSVTSGIDWFELRANVDFGGASATLPALLAALRKGENIVRLDDGSFGLLPEEWLKKYAVLAGTGKSHDDHVRFTKTQAGVLDALLAAQPQSSCDATFMKISSELRSFQSIQPENPPVGFIGELREYQREGLGWLYFLQRFGFGGCLADDMGLGKTVQVLALLESRRELNDKTSKKIKLTSLAVVPRSLVFNWKQEAARFSPQLKVLDHTGPARDSNADNFKNYHLILTTYGTLRSDITFMKDVDFDYVILDEAQTIKNADTVAAKAARLVKGSHRLCMSGTPVENHLNDLWSMFEFLNPGMLGTASVFQKGLNTGGEDLDSRAILSRALRPFILRRTKAQVAKDLPEKTEQTIFCEMEPAQKKLYADLRDHYRQSLLGIIDRDGINSSKIQILEALLRLRQAACHPGLIDKEKSDDASAKLDALLPQLEEVLEEGHKALVFSQFTSFLTIAKRRLDAAGLPYEYLDGKTRDRQAKVDRFQNDPTCNLFLISLKAGGLGLNLTAAEYVFLLDPWWNPAVEAQAIDRAHRIGQTQQVFAYRLIVRDTIEEKVLQLQKSKRDLADAIIGAGNSVISGLKREDLELLLG